MKFFKAIKQNRHNIKVGVLFLLTALLIVYILPREGTFRYEFQRGRPWLHETLIAPFDFPIYKSDAELSAEKDSVRQSAVPYFRYDSVIYQNMTEKFESETEIQWENFLIRSFNIGEENVEDFLRNNPALLEHKNRYFDTLSGLIEDIYMSGIREPVDETEIPVNIGDEVVILINNVGQRFPAERLYTQKNAYEKVAGAVAGFREDAGTNIQLQVLSFFASTDFSDYIVPNVFYDGETTNRVLQSMLDDISLARGMVQSGERIVSKGDLITGEVFMMLESLKREYEARYRGTNLNLIFLGQLILVLSAVFVLYLFLFNFRREILLNLRKTMFILFITLLMVLTAIMLIRFSQLSYYIIPFAIVPIIIRTFYDERLALFLHIILLLIVGFFVPNSFEFIFLNFMIGIVAIFSLSGLHRRSKLFLTSAIIILSYSALYFGIAVIQERSIEGISWINFAWFGGNGLLILMAYPLLYIFEKAFGFLSEATLMELSDTNQPLLRKLAEEAPGTFQHSIQVSNMAENAIFLIGGNSLLVRTGALYHDMGKMTNPAYFIENQTSGMNPHDMKDFDESAQIIINHVHKGVEIARRYNLPSGIIDFIQTHHGTSRVQYFYRSFLKKFPDEDVDPEKFTYPGPRPFSKETAVVMMADSVEAASRSLKEITGEAIDELVESIINYQLLEDQLIDAHITFKEVTQIKEIFKKKLRTIYHARLEYPK